MIYRAPVGEARSAIRQLNEIFPQEEGGESETVQATRDFLQLRNTHSNTKKKMVKVYAFPAGNTLDYHLKFLKKVLKRFRDKVVQKPEKSDVTLVFCPIVSRFETDVGCALSRVPDSARECMILVAMHHTFDPNYALPSQRQMEEHGVTLFVDCLFFEHKGLLRCSRNKNAIKEVRRQLKQRRKEPPALRWRCGSSLHEREPAHSRGNKRINLGNEGTRGRTDGRRARKRDERETKGRERTKRRAAADGWSEEQQPPQRQQ
ncbi:hypothetical protein Q5P01_023246 [Channa striata]|uniref:Uncharacterized protein n=1 Tax=Channa striata TaxID=64152 RepID=A0AA88IW06_CHASR|nr:hypothetical protein Q5P01_023246 [Channa striata]